MGVDGKDILRWLQETADTLQGKNRNKPGGETTYKGIVQPLKAGADITGLTQGIKGMRPDASPMDQALALMVLGGMAAGPADDIVRGASQVGQAGKLKALDMFGPKAEMFHGSAVSGIKTLEPRIAPAAGTAYGKPSPYVYLADPEDVLKNLMAYMKPSGMKSLDADTRAVTGSVYRTKVPKHRLETYGKTGSTHWGKRSAIPVKVTGELAADKMPTAEFKKALEEFVRRTK
jgi:hypothetical protein